MQGELAAALQGGNLRHVQKLCGRDAELVHRADANGWTPLFFACFYRQREVVKWLLSREADPDAETANAFSPLYIASYNGDVDVATLLLGCGATVDGTHKDGFSPLYVASEQGHIAVVTLLLDAGADVNHANRDGDTALHIAARGGKLEIVRKLLECGANVGLENKHGVTPLYVGMYCKHVDTVRELLRAGADVDVQDKDKHTPLFAACKANSVAGVQVLLEAGADTSLPPYSTGLMHASQEGYLETLRLLLANDAETEVRSLPGESPHFTPLYSAAQNGHTKAVHMLLEHMANPDATSPGGFTALHVAARHSHVAIVKDLLKHRASALVTSEDGHTALHFAAQSGSEPSVTALLRAGADPSARNDAGESPVDMAAKEAHTALATQLRRASDAATSAAASAHRALKEHLAQHAGELVKFVYSPLRSSDEVREAVAAMLTVQHVESFGALLDGVVKGRYDNNSAVLKAVQQIEAERGAEGSAAEAHGDEEGGAPGSAKKKKKKKRRKKKNKRRGSNGGGGGGGGGGSGGGGGGGGGGAGGSGDTSRSDGGQSDGALSAISDMSEGSLSMNDHETWASPTDTDKAEPLFLGKSMVVHRNVLLGTGSQGTRVYQGMFEGRDAAIKRIDRTYWEAAEKEVQLLIKLSKEESHRNIVRYFGTELDEEYVYVAMELCDQTLHRFMSSHRKKIPDKDTLHSIVRNMLDGVAYLHTHNVVHNDLNPKNILLTGKLTAKVADFGLGRALLEDHSSFSFSSNAPTCFGGWNAPEIMRNERKTAKVDIFSLGELFYYVWTGGRHPFESAERSESQSMHLQYLERASNIMSGKRVVSALSWWPEARDLVLWMTEQSPARRPTIAQVGQHPVFWSNTDKLNFLSEVSARVEKQVTNHAFLNTLNKSIAPYLNGDDGWKSRVPKSLMSAMSRSRHYNGKDARNLLRFVRNLHIHRHNLPGPLRAQFGSTEEIESLMYTSFRTLLMCTIRGMKRTWATELDDVLRTVELK